MKKTRVNYAHVAELAREAHALGVAASSHIAGHLEMTVKTANVAIHRARLAGHDIPALPNNPTSRTPAHNIGKRHRPDGLALRCAECTRTYPVDRLADLVTHVGREHARIATTLERTPR